MPFALQYRDISSKKNHYIYITALQFFKMQSKELGRWGIDFAIVTIMAQHTSKTDLKIFLKSSDFKGINTCSVVTAYIQRDNIPLIAADRKSMLIY